MRRAFPELTEREEEILSPVAQGKTNQQIAKELFVSLKTVRNHVSNIFLKLQVADRAQAVIRAREAGLGQKNLAEIRSSPGPMSEDFSGISGSCDVASLNPLIHNGNERYLVVAFRCRRSVAMPPTAIAAGTNNSCNQSHNVRSKR